MLTGLLLDMPEKDDPSIPAVAIATASADIIEPLQRMLRFLATPQDIPVFAPLAERELYYRLLQGPMGNTLRQAGACPLALFADQADCGLHLQQCHARCQSRSLPTLLG